MTIHTSSARQTHSRFAERDIANRTGLFLVRPEHIAGANKASVADSQSPALYALAAAALAAPLLWLLHSAMHLLPIR